MDKSKITKSLAVFASVLLIIIIGVASFAYFGTFNVNLVNNVDVFSNIKIELIATLIILLTMIIFEKIRPFKDTKLNDIFEVIVLIMIYLPIAQETITFNYIVSALYLFYGIIKKKDIFITLGIVLILLSALINLIQSFSTLATIFIILVIGISLIGYVLYKETKKNKN